MLHTLLVYEHMTSYKCTNKLIGCKITDNITVFLVTIKTLNDKGVNNKRSSQRSYVAQDT